MTSLLVCRDCDLIHRAVAAPPHWTLRCRRCNGVLQYPIASTSLDPALAWNLTGVVLLALANLFPILHLSIAGQQTQTTLISGAWALYRSGQEAVAVLIVLLLVVAPLLLFFARILVLWGLRRGHLNATWSSGVRLIGDLEAWMMFDVFMLAILVATVKLTSLAQVSPGPGLWAFLGLMLATVLALRHGAAPHLWQRFAQLAGAATLTPAAPHSAAYTAAAQGRVACHACGWLTDQASSRHCPRCHSPLHRRKPNSLARTWALLITGFVLFLPANFLPMTVTQSIFGTQADTILSGVLYFWHEGAYDLAIVIFTASIFVPLAKLLALTVLAIAAQRQAVSDPLRLTRLYRIIEFMGKWSMLDVFVVALLAQLVQFSSVASITPGPGAFAFAALVIVTLLATQAFDPRLLWDGAIGDHRLEPARA